MHLQTGSNDFREEIAEKNGWVFKSSSGGNDTYDKVFLLNVEEAMQYAGIASYMDFADNPSELLQTTPTKYAEINGEYMPGVAEARW